MNKAQIGYTMSRIDELLATKLNDIRSRNTKKAKRISAEDRANLIRSGAVGLRTDVTEISSYADVVDVFDFSKHAWPDTPDAAAIAAEMKPFTDEAQRLKDKIMLGDETTALAALELFAGKVKTNG
jgi:hypothetical protein